MDSRIERQNNIIKAYFCAFINFEQNNWAQLLFMIKFIYNNIMNASTGHILFELNCGYQSRIFYKKNLDLHSKSKIIEELSF